VDGVGAKAVDGVSAKAVDGGWGDQVAIVTGAGSPDGIGFAVAKLLANFQVKVMLTSMSERCLVRANELGAAATAKPADLTDPASVDALVAAALEKFARIDILVNNAGMTSVDDPMPTAAPVHLSKIDSWQHTLTRNLLPTYLVTRAVLPHMRERNYGRIVNVASTTGVTGAMFGESAYAAAKSAVVGFTKTVALENASVGVTVNAVAPGWVATASQTEDEAHYGQATPAGRSGTPDEIAHVIAMLCAPGASYITGQCLVVDGGNSTVEELGHRP
jgi:3-oxoacyl-[acyl-carrier protein] reductase